MDVASAARIEPGQRSGSEHQDMSAINHIRSGHAFCCLRKIA